MSDIGHKIRDARESAGINQTEFQKLVFGTKGNAKVSAIENGSRDVTVKDLEKIGEITGKPLSWFLDINEPTPASNQKQFDEPLREAYKDDIPRPIKSFRLQLGALLSLEDRVPSYIMNVPADLARGVTHIINVDGDAVVGGVKKGDMLFMSTLEHHEQKRPPQGSLVLVILSDEGVTLRKIDKYTKYRNEEFVWLVDFKGMSKQYKEKDIELLGIVEFVLKKPE